MHTIRAYSPTAALDAGSTGHMSIATQLESAGVVSSDENGQ